MTTATQQRRSLRWVLAFLAALVAVMATVFGAATASAAPNVGAETRVRARAVVLDKLVEPSEHIAAGHQLGEAVAWPRIVVATGVAAEAASSGISMNAKIAGQMGPRGWSESLMRETIDNPVAAHAVWDLTNGTRAAATAYARMDGSYVVVNNATREVVQVSNIYKIDWRPVWIDPRFIR